MAQGDIFPNSYYYHNIGYEVDCACEQDSPTGGSGFEVAGAYGSDEDAFADGVAEDNVYELSQPNVFGLASGFLRLRKSLLVVLLLLMSMLLYGQDKGFAIMVFNTKVSMDAMTPNLRNGSELAYVLEDSTYYRWSRDKSQWVKYTTGKVYEIPNAADTSTITTPYEGDVAYIADTLMFIRGQSSWLTIEGISGNTLTYYPDRQELADTSAAIRGDFPSGTVTSVGLSLPSQFTVTGSPVTTSGTLSGAWQNQAANTVLAGPSSGGAAAPTFRSLVAADITAGGGVTGSGVANQYAYFSGPSTLASDDILNIGNTYSSLGGSIEIGADVVDDRAALNIVGTNILLGANESSSANHWESNSRSGAGPKIAAIKMPKHNGGYLGLFFGYSSSSPGNYIYFGGNQTFGGPNLGVEPDRMYFKTSGGSGYSDVLIYSGKLRIGISSASDVPAYSLDIGGTAAMRLNPSSDPVYAPGVFWYNSTDNRFNWTNGVTKYHLVPWTTWASGFEYSNAIKANQFYTPNIVIGSNYIQSYGSSSGIYLNYNGSGPIRFYGGGTTTRGYIGSNGNWGFGTESPLRKVHVEGTTRITGSVDTASIDNIVTSNSLGDLRHTPLSEISLGASSIGTLANNYIPVYNSSGDSLKNSLVYDDGSGVAIGNSTVASNRLLYIKGASSTSTTFPLEVENSSFAEILQVRDDGKVTLGGGTGLVFDRTSKTAYMNPSGSYTTSTNTSFAVRGNDDLSTSYALRAFRSNFDPIFVARNDGRVGVGTTSPGYVLDVSGASAALRLQPYTGTPVNASGVYYTSSTNRPHFMDGTTDWPIVRGAVESFTTGSLLFSGTTGQAQQDNSNLFWDNVNKRLGIGTVTPDGVIAVESGDYQWGCSPNVTISSITGTQFGSTNAAGTSSSGRHAFFLGDASIFRSIGGVFIGDIGSEKIPSAKLNVKSSSATLIFLAEDGTGNPILSAERANRRVGIGTTSPQRALHVTGEMRVTDLTTDTPTRIVGADIDGDFGEMTAGPSITVGSGQINVTTPLSGSGAPVVNPRFNGDKYFDYTNNKWYMAWDNEDGDGTGDGLDADDWIMLN